MNYVRMKDSLMANLVSEQIYSMDIINKLHKRFQSLKYVNYTFQAIQPQELIKLSDDELYERARRIIDKYNKDINDSFPTQLISMRSCLKSSITKLTTVKE